jgi:anti-sigma factor RsiW
MHLSPETQSAYAEGTLAPDEAKAAHRHLTACDVCARGVADQLAIMHALAQLSRPATGDDGWPALAAALADDYAEVPAVLPSKIGRPLLPVRPQRWAAAAVLTLGLAVSLALSISQPAPADDEVHHFWQEHHRYSSHSSLSARHVAQFNSLTWTHRLREETRR